MTDDELDLLASAYLDGEATPEEVALVERDPDLLARVEEFRVLAAGGESPLPPAGLAERHLAAAMAEFETLAIAGPGAALATDAGPAAVVDLRERRADRASRSLPTWLPAAAAFVLIGGGIVWAVGRTGGGDDATTDFEAATAEADTSADAMDMASDQGAAEGEEMAQLAADDAAADREAADGAENDAMAATEAAPAADGERSTGDASGGAEEATAASTTIASSAPPAPVAAYDEVPDPDTLTDLPEPIADLGLSRCGPEVVTPGLGDPLGFLPIEVAGRPAELFVFLQGDGTEVRLLVDESCLLLEP